MDIRWGLFSRLSQIIGPFEEMDKINCGVFWVSTAKNLSRLCHCMKVLNIEQTEVCFASFVSGGFTTMAVINPPEKKLAKNASLWTRLGMSFLTGQDWGLKFYGQVLSEWTKSRLIFTNILHKKYKLSIL